MPLAAEQAGAVEPGEPATASVDEVRVRRTVVCDRVAEDYADRAVQAAQFDRRETRDRATRMDPRQVQALVGVDVADPGNRCLIEQRGLDRRRSVVGQALPERGKGEHSPERFGAHAGQERIDLEVRARDDAKVREFAMVVEEQGPARAERHHGAGPRIRHRAGWVGGRMAAKQYEFSAPVHHHLSGHPEMQKQLPCTVQVEDQRLAAAADRFDPVPCDDAIETRSWRLHESWPQHVDRIDSRALHGPFEAATQRFDFRHFGHAAMVRRPTTSARTARWPDHARPGGAEIRAAKQGDRFRGTRSGHGCARAECHAAAQRP